LPRRGRLDLAACLAGRFLSAQEEQRYAGESEGPGRPSREAARMVNMRTHRHLTFHRPVCETPLWIVPLGTLFDKGRIRGFCGSQYGLNMDIGRG
jgi:hypothetical protein